MDLKRETHWEKRMEMSWETLSEAGLDCHWDSHWERQMAG